jgi:CheY-like chemotaxis protein
MLLDPSPNGSTARRNLLEEEGYQVEVFPTLEAACLRLAAGQPSVAVVSCDDSGGNAIGRLRASGLTSPAILISGIAESAGLNPETTGADAVIQKSASEISVLKREIQRLLRPRPVRRKPAQAAGSAASKTRDSKQA